MLIKRLFWQQRIEEAWKQRSVVWLMGIRRVGKTSLCLSLPNIEYFDCERPGIRQLMENPETFLANQRGKRIVLDEVHRLDNPSELLKLAADYYPEIKIVATGSSTLGASSKFKDTLTGRKREVWLTPILLEEMTAFGSSNLEHRFLLGGLPSFFAQEQLPEVDFQEWVDAYWAKDIQDIFSVGKRQAFQKFTELLLTYSGGQFEASKFSDACEVSRQSITNYLAVLEATFVVHVLRPYATHKPTEIVSAPKVYGFDTGFVCYAKGWRSLRKEDFGLLWEHCVLNELYGHLQRKTVHYWRDKKGHEVDFVLHNRTKDSLIVIECKLSSLGLKPDRSSLGANIAAFRSLYPQGENYIVTSDIEHSFTQKYEDFTLTFVNLKQLIELVKQSL